MAVVSKTCTYTTYHCGKQFRLTDGRIIARSRRSPRVGSFNVGEPWYFESNLLRMPSANYYTDFIHRYMERWQRHNRALAVRVRFHCHRILADSSELVSIIWYGTDLRGDESRGAINCIRLALAEHISCEVAYSPCLVP